jgi:hypothetical protein
MPKPVRMTAPAPADSPIDLAAVLPTYNERENVAQVIASLEDALDGLRWELIFVWTTTPPTARRMWCARTRGAIDGSAWCTMFLR